MVIIRNLFVCLIFSLALCSYSYAATQEPAKDPPPDTGKLGSRLGILNDFVDKNQKQLEQLQDLADPQKDYLRLSQKLQTLRSRAQALGKPAPWNRGHIGQVRNQYAELKTNLEELQQKMARQQSELERITLSLEQELSFWRSGFENLQSENQQLPTPTLTRITGQLKELESSAQAIVPEIFHLQERISRLQQDVNDELERLDKILETQRKSTLRRTAPLLFSSEFNAQFNDNFWPNIRQGWINFFQLDTNYLSQYSVGFALMLLVLVFIPWGVLRYRQQLQTNPDWLFVSRHPFATAIFVAALLGSNLLTGPPPFVRFALIGAESLSVIVLLKKLISSQTKYHLLVLAAFFYLVTPGLSLSGFPLPLYRLYLTGFCLGLLAILFNDWRKNTPDKKFSYLLRLIMGVLVIALFSQVSGYINLSNWLLRAGFESGFLLLFALIIVRLGRGLLNFIFHHPRLLEQHFFQNFSDELVRRLEFLLKTCVGIYCFLNLMSLWQLSTSSQMAWTTLSNLTVEIGSLKISLTMVFLASLTSYFAIQVSWLVQAAVDSRMSAGKDIDRGVRDAIKKLIHYGIITFGFLAVLSLLGMRVQNFVVVLGALGVGIGFGLQDIINNFLSGLILLFERPVKVGDLIVVNDEWGTINKIGLRSTTVQTIENAEIIVPNSQLISEKVTNWTHSSSMARLKVPVGVAYGSDVPLVMKILSEIATSHTDVVETKAPAILFTGFGASSLDFEIRTHIDDINKSFRIRSEILQEIDSRFREAKIEIPFPQRDLHLRSVDEKLVQTLKSKENM